VPSQVSDSSARFFRAFEKMAGSGRFFAAGSPGRKVTTPGGFSELR